MRNSHLKTILALAGGVVLLVTILPFLLLTCHIHPQSDDFAVDAVLRTLGILEAQVEWYHSWTGRYFAHLIISIIHPLQYGHPEWVRLISFTWIIFFVFSVWYFVRAFTTNKDSIFPTALLISVYCWQMPSPGEAFYWIPASLSYQLGISLLLIFLGRLKRGTTTIGAKAILLILAALIPGTSEINLIIFICTLSSILLFRQVTGLGIPRFYFQLVSLAFVMCLFSLMSPGNTSRAHVIAQSTGNQNIHNLVFSIREGFVNAKSALFFLLARTPLILFSFLLILIKPSFCILQGIRLKAWMIILFWLSAFTLFVLLHIPFIFQTGIIYIPGRVSNVIILFFLVAWAAGVLITSSYLIGESEYPKEKTIAMATGLLLTFCLFQLTIPNKIEHAWMDTLSGKAAQYDAWLNQRSAFLKTASGQNVMVSALPVKPSSIFLVDLEKDPFDWKNLAYARYYGVKSIVVGDSSKVIKP